MSRASNLLSQLQSLKEKNLIVEQDEEEVEDDDEETDDEESEDEEGDENPFSKENRNSDGSMKVKGDKVPINDKTKKKR